jgi:hypothetical protein
MQMNQGLSFKFSDSIGFSSPSKVALKALDLKVQNQVFMMTFLQLVITMMFILGIAIFPLMRMKVKKSEIKMVDAH